MLVHYRQSEFTIICRYSHFLTLRVCLLLRLSFPASQKEQHRRFKVWADWLPIPSKETQTLDTLDILRHLSGGREWEVRLEPAAFSRARGGKRGGALDQEKEGQRACFCDIYPVMERVGVLFGLFVMPRTGPTNRIKKLANGTPFKETFCCSLTQYLELYALTK